MQQALDRAVRFTQALADRVDDEGTIAHECLDHRAWALPPVGDEVRIEDADTRLLHGTFDDEPEGYQGQCSELDDSSRGQQLGAALVEQLSHEPLRERPFAGYHLAPDLFKELRYLWRVSRRR